MEHFSSFSNCTSLILSVYGAEPSQHSLLWAGRNRGGLARARQRLASHGWRWLAGRLDIGRHWPVHEFQTGQRDLRLLALLVSFRGLSRVSLVARSSNVIRGMCGPQCWRKALPDLCHGILSACSHSSKSGRHGATCNMVMKVMDAMTDGDRPPSSFMVSTPAAIISGVMIA